MKFFSTCKRCEVWRKTYDNMKERWEMVQASLRLQEGQTAKYRRELAHLNNVLRKKNRVIARLKNRDL